MEDSINFQRLKSLIKDLRAPDGCPWDREQTSISLLPQFLEEVYEFADAVHENDKDKIKEELGDLFLHLVFQIVIAEEQGEFSEYSVFEEIISKIIRRHPHVFGDLKGADIATINKNWDDIKSREKGKESRRFFDSIPKSLPALLKSYEITKRVAKVGFDWSSVANIFEKLGEELDEVEEALIEKDSRHIEEEIGDVLFMIVNLCRFLNINPEQALNNSNSKFMKRFLYIEDKLLEKGKSLDASSLKEMDFYWEESKKP